MTPRPEIEPGPHWWEASALIPALQISVNQILPQNPFPVPRLTFSFNDQISISSVLNFVLHLWDPLNNITAVPHFSFQRRFHLLQTSKCFPVSALGPL